MERKAKNVFKNNVVKGEKAIKLLELYLSAYKKANGYREDDKKIERV